MSKPYVLRVHETVRRHVVVEDGVQTRLDLLEILPTDETSLLLEQELAKRGFTVEGGVATRTDEQGIVTRIDIEKRSVHVGKREERDVEVVIDRDVRSYKAALDDSDIERIRNEEGEAVIEQQRERDRRKFTDQIEKKLGDARQELDAIVVAVTQQALRKRASQIGDIESIEEDAETGSMTIRVRV